MPQPIDARSCVPTRAGLVLAVLATDQERLRSALRRVAASPELVAATTRIVVLETGRAASLLQEAVRLPVGLLRVVPQPSPTRPEALARLLLEAADERSATTVLVLDDVALTDPAVLVEAFSRAQRSSTSEVIGLRDAAANAGPSGWWGAALPLDVVRAIGATLPEAGAAALAELVLRADATGFRSVELVADGPEPAVDEAELLLLALLHAPVDARRALLAGALRPGSRDGLRALLGGPDALRAGAPPARVGAVRLRLWMAWPALRRRYRTGAMARASVEAWTLRFLGGAVNQGLPRGEREAAAERPAGLRLRAWSTRRGTSAA